MSRLLIATQMSEQSLSTRHDQSGGLPVELGTPLVLIWTQGRRQADCRSEGRDQQEQSRLRKTSKTKPVQNAGPSTCRMCVPHRDEREEDDLVLRDPLFEQQLDRVRRAVARPQYGVHQQHVPVRDVAAPHDEKQSQPIPGSGLQTTSED